MEPMKKIYNLKIKNHDRVLITHADVTVDRPVEDLFSIFGAVNPFVNMMLPKVLVYTSRMIHYHGTRLGFCIVEYNPRTISYGEDKETMVPWSHIFIVYDYDRKLILDFALMFSKTQLQSEFSHTFYVPNVEDEFLTSSFYLDKLFGISVPLFRIDKHLPVKERFAQCVTQLRQLSFEAFFTSSRLEVDLFTDPNEYDAKITSYFSSTTIDIGDIDSRVMELAEVKPSFTQRIIDYYNGQLEAESQ